MSVREQLRRSGLFQPPVIRGNGTMRFPMLDWEHGKSVYLTPNGDLHIRIGAVALGRFPNNDRLRTFIRAHSHGTTRVSGNRADAYKLRGEYAGKIVEIFRGATPRNSNRKETRSHH